MLNSVLSGVVLEKTYVTLPSNGRFFPVLSFFEVVD
jgi:hypothetical protein